MDIDSAAAAVEVCSRPFCTPIDSAAADAANHGTNKYGKTGRDINKLKNCELCGMLTPLVVDGCPTAAATEPARL